MRVTLELFICAVTSCTLGGLIDRNKASALNAVELAQDLETLRIEIRMCDMPMFSQHATKIVTSFPTP